MGQRAFRRQPVGTGPFRLRSLDDQQAVLLPYEGAARGRPKLDLLIVRFYPTAQAASEALRRQEVQGVASLVAAGTSVSPPPPATRDLLVPLGEYTILTFNLREAPLDDDRVRTALARGLDRDLLIKRLFDGRAQRLDTPVLPETFFHGPASLPAPTIDGAEQTLDVLGWRVDRDGHRTRSDGLVLRLPLTVLNDREQQAIAAEIARQWRRSALMCRSKLSAARS